MIGIQSVSNGRYVRAGIDFIGCYLGAVSPHLHLWEGFKIHMLGDGKVAFQSIKTGKYVRAGLGEKSRLGAASSHLQIWEAFRLVDLGNRKVALQSVKSNKYASISYNIPNFDVMALSSNIAEEQTFELRQLGDDKVAFRSIALGRYVRAGIGNDSYLGAINTSADVWETFRLHPILQARTTARSDWENRPARDEQPSSAPRREPAAPSSSRPPENSRTQTAPAPQQYISKFIFSNTLKFCGLECSKPDVLTIFFICTP
ncbi:MAG: hypothetical protein HYS08_04975 [Chlamydiae bacterium]|nr:hypothetical protein [Chlamydiota bacterium]MBI3267104.1 hypothetical protein [Chlamydiota bacterium]